MSSMVVRIGTRALRHLRRLKAKRGAKVISRVELSECLNEPRGAQSFLSDFRSRKEPVFFFDRSDIQFLEKSSLLEKERIVKDADAICNHEFDLLGSGKRTIDGEGGKIDWHRDFKSGVSWDPGAFFTETPFLKGGGSDIKVPWELSRFQHLPTLGKAHCLTGNESYAKEFVGQIGGWIGSNPPQYGVNWTCTMDVAIRVVNWIWGYYFFKDSPEVGDDFLLEFLNSLIIHGRHIMANLERGSRVVELLSNLLVPKMSLTSSLRRSRRRITNNHYLSDVLGLVYLGIMLPEFKDSRKWREFGIRQLIREMGKQVYPDGVCYESSTSYHRLQTELFLSPTLLCLRNGMTFPQWYMERLEKMLEFVLYYTKPDGTAPQIGDNDDGRLHILSDYGDWDKRDHRHLLATGASLFGRSDFKQAGGLCEEGFWLLGEERLMPPGNLADSHACLSSKAFSWVASISSARIRSTS